MASGGHEMRLQRSIIESSIKRLLNSQLKDICKTYSQHVSGSKALLQQRVIEVLHTVVARGDPDEFRDFQSRVNNPGKTPSSQPAPSLKSSNNNYQLPNGSHNYNAMTRGRPSAGGGGGRTSLFRHCFKVSPFYEVFDTVLPLYELLEMPQNRNTVKTTLQLNPDQVSRLTSDSSMRLLLYCGLNASMGPNDLVDIAFPNQLEVKVNGDDVKSNFKGLKNKPGTTKPADITEKVRLKANYPNQLIVTYALTQKRYSYGVYLVKRVSVDVLTERIRIGNHGGGVISRQKVLDEMSRANADDDIAATSIRMSLKDPISTLRITLPIRSTVCAHNQCFDGAMFMQLQDQAPQWSCPVCSKSVTYESLCVDKYFEDILQKTPSSVEKVDIEPDGQWHFIKEEEGQTNGHSSRGERAAYDNDFDDDDDLIDVTESQTRSSTNGPPAPSNPTPIFFPPAITAGNAMNTPPMSSRGASTAPSATSVPHSNKRAASAVIDLTLSDDDEPPRPAKRQATTSSSTHYGNSTHYNTPSSLPDYGYSHYAGAQGHTTDSYRPSSSTARPANNHSWRSGNQLPSSSPASGPGSPVQVSGNYSTYPNGGNWVPQHLGGSLPGLPGYAAGFQAPASRPPANPAQHGQNGLAQVRPMQPPDYSSGWRSDYSYSHSPPG